jgi:hypothetical protein
MVSINSLDFSHIHQDVSGQHKGAFSRSDAGFVRQRSQVRHGDVKRRNSTRRSAKRKNGLLTYRPVMVGSVEALPAGCQELVNVFGAILRWVPEERIKIDALSSVTVFPIAPLPELLLRFVSLTVQT